MSGEMIAILGVGVAGWLRDLVKIKSARKTKKQWLFGVGGFLLLGLIVGCANQEPEATQAEAEPAATAPADPAAEFSESTKLLLALYQELHLFKDDPEFHEVGFGACCRFHDWQTRVQELQSRTNLETLMDIDVVPGDLLVLGLEYMKSKGSPTAYTQTMDPKFRSAVSVTVDQESAPLASQIDPPVQPIPEVASVTTASQTDSLGEWRDYMGDFWDHNLRIVQEDNRYVMIVRPTRGKPLRRELTELPAQGVRRFKVDAADGIYVIQADGDLGLYDSEGLIRVAKKIE